jgi:thioredoxin-related protein
MDKDILIAIVLIVVLLIFYFYISPSKSENFAQEDSLEPETAFDSSVNSASGNETHGEAFDDEANEKNAVVPAKKAQVIVFLSKHCPHCVHYDRDKFTRLKGKLNKLSNGNVSVKKIYADKDPNGLFNKYEVQFVPAAVVLHNNKTSKISGEISPANSLNTISKLAK